jgi:hypothetical protein
MLRVVFIKINYYNCIENIKFSPQMNTVKVIFLCYFLVQSPPLMHKLKL